MEGDLLNPVIIVQAIVGLVGIVTGVALLVKAFSFQYGFARGILIHALSLLLLLPAGLLMPLWLLSGEPHQLAHLQADVLMYGISGLLGVAILCFIIDHLTEFPGMLLVAAAACFAAAIFPWIYWAGATSLHQRFSIQIVEPPPKSIRDLTEMTNALLEEERARTAEVDEDDPLGNLPKTTRGTLPATDVNELTAPPSVVVPGASAPDTKKDWLFDSPK
ncbi:MAG: hypothetical protein KF752_13595 [Pirellulaceae bacterium]|nr:hypothetical protein [Pirellulaceae bacterium]